jgi:poly(3-hydroxyalkanoate) depolymerase
MTTASGDATRARRLVRPRRAYRRRAPKSSLSHRRTFANVVPVLGQRIRVKVRDGAGVPLVLCNGIGASLEVLDPLVAALDPDTTVVRFDVPGVGGSPTSPLPYGFPYLAVVLGRLVGELGISGPVDVLGYSWGGALAQQFAFQNPRRCRKLILVSTGTGAIMVPGKPQVLVKMLTPRRFVDRNYVGSIAGDLYGGSVRTDAAHVARLFDRPATAGARVGYLHQLLAGAVWTSIFALPLIRQDTLIMAGTDDPIVPVVNAKIMAGLMPRATLYLHSGGHAELVTDAAELAPVIEEFRNPDRGQHHPEPTARDTGAGA